MKLPTRCVGIVLTLLITVLAAEPVTAGPSGTGVDAGDAVIVDAVDTNRELGEFDGNALFRLRLPDGATCPGDSANDDYRVQTFLVPDGTDLSTLTYELTRPTGSDDYWGLRYVDGEWSLQEMTDQNPGPNQPAAIVDYAMPFTFARYDEIDLEPGRWKVGVACTPVPGWNVERYWDADILLEDAPEVESIGLRISVVPTDLAPSKESGGGPVYPVFIVALAAIAAVALIVKRSGRRTRPYTKEIRS